MDKTKPLTTRDLKPGVLLRRLRTYGCFGKGQTILLLAYIPGSTDHPSSTVKYLDEKGCVVTFYHLDISLWELVCDTH